MRCYVCLENTIRNHHVDADSYTLHVFISFVAEDITGALCVAMLWVLEVGLCLYFYASCESITVHGKNDTIVPHAKNNPISLCIKMTNTTSSITPITPLRFIMATKRA